jgi:uncharacterized protein YyaL (SSP411 family)
VSQGDRYNHLAGEASPYLVAHSKNPVDWYPWGPEALSRAVREDKPILLSIGYSACHWCHVMERESFENEAVAALMNERFINIKVDREERPDLDQVYQAVVQLLRQSGGWPLTVFLTPQEKPFYGGTYFPPEDRYGLPSFAKVLRLVSDAYAERREDVELQAKEVSSAIEQALGRESRGDRAVLGPDLLSSAAEKLTRRFDDQHGGFGGRPKFPNTMPLDILLRRGALEGDSRALARVSLALGAMESGGVMDQLGGGFHRYSTDAAWRVPHFEKMLYDNALLLRLYVDAFRATRDPRWEATASTIADYVLRDMQAPEGAFFATEDADSEGEEGKFFVWDRAEVAAALRDDELTELVCLHFGITEEGNFEGTRKTVLRNAVPVESLAIKRGRSVSSTILDLARAKASLWRARESRPRPFRDEKILSSWNGLMISAMGEAAGALGRPELLVAAEKAFAFLERVLITDSRVHRLAKDDVVKRAGFLDDQAFVAVAALDLYEATGRPSYASTAQALVDALLAHFADPSEGGFFFTPDDGEALLHRAKDPYDQAIPSGASIACLALSRLGVFHGEPYAGRAQKELERVAGPAIHNPFGYGQTLAVLDRLVRGSVDIALVGPREDPRTISLAQPIWSAYLPNRTVAWLDPTDERSRSVAPELFLGKEFRDTPVAYVCRGRTCSLPLSTAEDLRGELERH